MSILNDSLSGKARVQGAKVASQIPPVTLEWLWDAWLPRGVITLLFGKQKVGKGAMLTDLVARVSNGSQMPSGDARSKGRVLWVESEDHVAATIVPRLMAAGANLDAVEIWDVSGAEIDYGKVAEGMASGQFALVVLSALKDTLPDVGGGKGDLDKYVRKAMLPIKALAETHNVAVVGIGHTNKKPDLSGMDRFSGAGAYTQYARQVLFMALEDDDDKDGPKRLTHMGGNLGRTPEDLILETTANDKGIVYVKEWRAADYSLGSQEVHAPRTKGKSNAVWLDGLLRVAGPDGIDRKEVERRAATCGQAWRTIERIFGKGQEDGRYISAVSGFPARAVWKVAEMAGMAELENASGGTNNNAKNPPVGDSPASSASYANSPLH